MNGLIELSATEMAKGIKEGQFTSEQLVQAHLDQIKNHNQKINAIVTPYENALERAKEADQALEKGEDWGPLHGVPITVKDSWATAGVKTTSSYKPLKNYVPEKDAVIVQNMLDAGVIILGKTNLPMLASDIQTNSPIFGKANNPWNVSRTTGGSTGGGAAAVSGRLSPIELGSDLAGSIRIPSHCCGVIGFKPTEGVLSVEGHIPPAPGKPLTVKHQNHAGLIARTVEDIKTVFECAGGSNVKAEKKNLKDYKAGWLDIFDDAPINMDTEKVFLDFVNNLGEHISGFNKTLPEGLDFQEIWETFGYLYGYEAGKGMPWFIRLIYKQSFRKPALAIYRGVFNGLGQNDKKYQNFLEKREKYINVFNSYFKKYDFWVCPVVSRQAFPHVETGKDIEVDGKPYAYWQATVSYTTLFNVTGLPVIVLPIGFASDGLPIGVQLVAGLGKDHQLLAFAKEVEKLLPAVGMPKGF
jgi:amidase